MMKARGEVVIHTSISGQQQANTCNGMVNICILINLSVQK